MTSPTTPLDLDAAIEAAARGLRAEFVGQGASDTTWEDYEHEARAALTAIGYPALVEEVKRLREGVESNQSAYLRAAEGRAAAEAKVAAGLDAIDGNPYYFPGWDQQFVDSERVRTRLTEVQAGAGASGRAHAIPAEEDPEGSR